jgi:hypothetical protein
MKATIDLPDELYRQVKAKSALEGRAIREVAAELFRSYLGQAHSAPEEASASQARDPRIPSSWEPPAWFGIARQHIRTDVSHEWSEIRKSIDRGWSGEVAEPAPTPTPPLPRKGKRR